MVEIAESGLSNLKKLQVDRILAKGIPGVGGLRGCYGPLFDLASLELHSRHDL